MKNRVLMCFSLALIGAVLVAASAQAADLIWSGGTSEWSNNSTAANWNGNTTPFADGDNVVFDDTNLAPYLPDNFWTVDISNGDVRPSSVIFNNNNNYMLTGSNALTGATGLTKRGSGTLTLQGPLGYTGGTSIQAGTIYVNAANGFYQGGVPVPIGNVTIEAGATLMGERANFTGTLTMNGGTWFDNNGFSGSWTGPVVLAAPNSYFGRADWYCYDQKINGTISGTGGFTLQSYNNNHTLTLNGSNSYSGDTTVASGTLRLSNAAALLNSTLMTNSLNGSVVFDSNVKLHAFTFGGLGGDGNLELTDDATTPNAVALSVGNNNASTIYSGYLFGTGSLTKIGSGTLDLLNYNYYTGDTIVNGGALNIYYPWLSYTGAVKIAAGAKMALNFTGDNTVDYLLLDGVSMAPGVHNATTDPLYFTGDGGLYVSEYLLGNYWAPAVGGGGSGTWESTSTVWANKAGVQGTTPQSTTYSLIFTDAGGTVTVKDTVTVNAGLTFESNYALNAGAGAPLINLAGANDLDNTITVATGKEVTIGVILAAANGFTKAGPGTLNITNDINITDGTMNVLAGKLALASGTITVGTIGGLTGGSMTVSTSELTIAKGATLTVNGGNGGPFSVQNGGTMVVLGTLNIGPATWGMVGSNDPGALATPEATMILKDSAKLNAQDTLFEVGDAGANDGKLIIQDSSELNASFLMLGQYGQGTKGVVIQEGNSTVNLTLNSGLWYTAPALQIGSAASINWGDTWGNGQGEYHLNGGTLNVHSIGGGNGANGGSSKFYFNGGIVKPVVSDAVIASDLAGMTEIPPQTFFMQYLTQVVVQEGGAIVDTNGQSITIAQNLEHGYAGTVDTMDGGLTKKGDGTLFITGALTYTGATVIEAGKLVLNNTEPNTKLSTISGAGELVVAGSTALTATSINVGTLTIGGSGAATTVPEPGTLILLTIAALLALVVRKHPK